MNTVSPQSSETFEQLIRQVEGVDSVRVVIDMGGEVGEIHVRSSSGRSPKQIVRDIETLFMTEWGMQIDHKKISVAQLSSGSPGLRRVVPQFIQYIQQQSTGEARVRLQLDDRSEEGVAVGVNSRHNKLRLTGDATAIALNALIATTEAHFVFDEVREIEMNDRPAVLVGLTLVQGKTEDELLGAVYVVNDTQEAVVKAVLDATNRRLGRL
jgi:hypothetical protein